MKRNLTNLFHFFIPAVLVVLLIKVYAPWFLSPLILAGDWPYFTHIMVQDWPVMAPFWTHQGGVGLGGVNPDFPIFSYQYFIVGFFVNFLNLSWQLVNKVCWFGLFLLLSFISSIFLYKVVKPKAEAWEKFLAAFIYLVNSYILMVVGGGQMGIALAYSVTPLVIGLLIIAQRRIEDSSIKSIFRSGLLLGVTYSLQIFFEPRTAYLTGLIMIFYVLYLRLTKAILSLKKQAIFWTTIMLVIFLLHSYWVVPFLLFHLLSVPKGITSITGFTFFSFADFSHAFSLLQPNWPENIFGKVSFLRPEFLLYPFVAFIGLIFNKGRKNSLYLFFAILVLIFTFLAKGTTEPFGLINTWIFSHIPGMNVFRDPTKFYYFIALGYIVMIPYSLSVLVESKIVGVRWKKVLFLIMSLMLLAFPIRDALLSKLTGTFIPTSVPSEYLQLESFLSSHSQFFRTLWVPDQSRFRFFSETHPMMVAETFFQTASQSAMRVDVVNLSLKKKLQDYAIKYIIVPDDTQGEIFLTDRKYDSKKRREFIQTLDTVSYLRRQMIGNIAVYEVPEIKTYLYVSNGKIDYQKIDNSRYNLQISSSLPAILHFSEAYNKNWIVRVQKTTIHSVQAEEGLNSFYLPAGKYRATLLFLPDELRFYFYAFSVVSLVVVITFILILR